MRWFFRAALAVYTVLDRRVLDALTAIARNNWKRATFAALHVALLAGHYTIAMCSVDEYCCGPDAAPSSGVLCAAHVGMFVVHYTLFALSLFGGAGTRDDLPR